MSNWALSPVDWRDLYDAKPEELKEPELPRNFGEMNVADVEAKFEQTFGNGFKVGGEGKCRQEGP